MGGGGGKEGIKNPNRNPSLVLLSKSPFPFRLTLLELFFIYHFNIACVGILLLNYSLGQLLKAWLWQEL